MLREVNHGSKRCDRVSVLVREMPVLLKVDPAWLMQWPKVLTPPTL
jgi:hypothetical protein